MCGSNLAKNMQKLFNYKVENMNVSIKNELKKNNTESLQSLGLEVSI